MVVDIVCDKEKKYQFAIVCQILNLNNFDIIF